MRVSFNTSLTIHDLDIIQIVGLMQNNKELVTKASFKAKAKYNLQDKGTDWLFYSIWEDKLDYGKQIAAWAVACQVLKLDITMPEREKK